MIPAGEDNYNQQKQKVTNKIIKYAQFCTFKLTNDVNTALCNKIFSKRTSEIDTSIEICLVVLKAHTSDLTIMSSFLNFVQGKARNPSYDAVM